ncbi:hypothetical protein MJO28_015830 [Puccinia striiformis f. sp. tritici]|uniref:Uncharacterized protein n=1 Tax=Puccinia striiformis f. sp. tritici TaxID=168172 RepID=A0ACC0DQ35_9BASI|nr:hypothetical protein MJO28_015830 [Puccinia striiformis f. sp. tritici]
MVAFRHGEWDYICQVSPQPICNLFYRQLLVHPDRGIQAAPDTYLGLSTDNQTEREQQISEAGLGIRSFCSLPRMESTGGKFNSLGNPANIVVCCVSIFAIGWLLLKTYKRKAAVARIEMMSLLTIYGLMKFFEILDTGSILKQGSLSIVWITSIHHSLTFIFYFNLIWIGFLSLQVVEDGTLLSLAPMFSTFAFLFIGSVYIFLDTGFAVTHYFSSQPASHLYSPWTFSMVILWPFISLTIYAGLTILVTVRILGELKPIIILLCGLITISIAEIFRWILTQPICHSSNATVDGSFIASILEMISVALLVYIWVSLTEAEWDEYNDLGFGYPPPPSNQPILEPNYSIRNPSPPNQSVHGHPDGTMIIDPSNNNQFLTPADHIHQHPLSNHYDHQPSSLTNQHPHLDPDQSTYPLDHHHQSNLANQ